MANRLRHLSAPTLKELEEKIERLKDTIDIINVTLAPGGIWFCHFQIGQFSSMKSGEPESAPLAMDKKKKKIFNRRS